MSETSWRAELTKMDEIAGRKPRFPIITHLEHISYEFERQNDILKDLSSSQREDAYETTSEICGTIELGFEELISINNSGYNAIIESIERGSKTSTDELKEVNRNLEQINGSLRWGFSAIIEQLTLTNRNLDNIIKLLNIPDSQKQRKYHIEQGFEFLKKSNLNSLFFAKAKENFEEVINIESSDFLSLQQLGIIHLYSSDFLSFDLSEKYFLDSILYSSAEIHYSRNIEKPSAFIFSYNPSKLTATSFMHLARNYYQQGLNQKAYDMAKEGLSYYEMVELFFDLSIYSSCLNDNQLTISYLNKAIERDRYVAIRTLGEKTLFSKDYVRKYLRTLSKKATAKATKEIKAIREIISNDSVYSNLLDLLVRKTNKDEYITSLEVLENLGYKLNN